MIHTWQKRASSSVQEGGWLKTYRATTWTNTATVSTAKRITIVVSTERRIGESGRRRTLLFNGYEEEVAHLYEGLDLSEWF